MILAGDVGGTKTVLAAYEPGSDPARPHLSRRYASRRYESLEQLVADFLEDTGLRAEALHLGVAGPVRRGRARITNLPWTLDEHALERDLGIPRVRLLNDLEAVAHALPRLEGDAFAVLQEREAEPDGTIAVVAPGTGLGMAFLVRRGPRPLACPTEGGHASFAPRGEVQEELLAWARARFGHVSVERVASGSGIANLYAFLSETGRARPSPEFAAMLGTLEDPVVGIVDAGLAEREAICVATLDLFVSVLAGVVGDAAVQYFATGGVMLAGGMPPRLLDRLRASAFLEAVRAQGRFGPFVQDLPLSVLLAPDAALRGAAHHAFQEQDA